MSEQFLFPFLQERVQLKRKPEFGTPEFRREYSRYITSAKWKRLCEAVRQRAKCRCERCPAISTQLEVHHITYERFQRELLTDLLALCGRCHEIADRKREEENQRRRSEARDKGKRNACKRRFFRMEFGEDWECQYDVDFESMEEDFESYDERRRECEDDSD